MESMLPSRCSILRLEDVGRSDGTSSFLWNPVITNLKVKVDLGFLRTGRDNSLTIEAGRTPDRTGTAFFAGNPDVRGADRIKITEGALLGMEFDIDIAPDLIQDSFAVHHLEAAVKEVTQRAPA